jgi:DNA-directed RNA polymerase specialized sigma24 family protein
MEITQRDYIRFKRLSMVITKQKYEEAEDLLQDVLLKIIEKQIPQDKLTDEYIFIALKNTWLNKQRKTNPFQEVEEIYDTIDTTQEDLRVLKREEEIIEGKLKAIDEVYYSLPIFDQQLFFIHFMEGISQRKIARETDIGMTIINTKVNNIKTKIKNIYGK